VALLDILPTEYIYQELTAGEAASHHWDQLFHCATGISERLLKGREELYRGGPIRLDSARGLDKWILCG
jgi:hypothetical protein